MKTVRTETNLFFSTYTNLNWLPVLANNEYKEIIISSLHFLVKDKRIKLFGFVIMPNHIHLLWQINEFHVLKDVQRDFLKFTAQKIRLKMADNSESLLAELIVNAKDRYVQIWERNGLSFMLNDPETALQKLNYIHQNPTRGKWRSVDLPEHYFYSSAEFYTSEIDRFNMLAHLSEII